MGANIPLVDALQTAFDHFEVGQLIGLEAFSETQQHLADLSEIGQRQTTALSMATLDDPLINAAAHRYAAQLRNGAWSQVATYQGMPVSSFSSLHPSGPVPAGMAMTSLMVISRPVRPGTPPPPPPPPPSTPVDMDPFAEPEIGFWNGLKTTLKALTNSSVDTAAGIISLGQWDPPDVWPVNPVTDIGYGTARFAADIVTNVAVGVATGGMGNMAGRVGQVARAVDRLDGVGNVVVGVQGGINALQNGVNLQNGMQMLNGMMGGAQLRNGAGRAAGQAAEVEAQAGMAVGARANVNAKLQAHPDLPMRGPHDRTHGILTDMQNSLSQRVVSGGPVHRVFESRWTDLSARARIAAIHAEGHAVGIMQENKLKEAVLYINNARGPCDRFCQQAIPELMSEGMRLWVVFDEGVGVFTRSGWERLL